MANALTRVIVPGMKRVERYNGAEAFDKIDGRKGVFFCKDFYGAPQTGDHIDLWNGWRLTAFQSVISIYTSFGSQYTKGRIWFWEVA
ncbi:T6SS effector amidase Tae4 family protein [Caldimonas brevitalea]